MNPYTVEARSAPVLVVRFDDVAVGWEQWFLLRSDAHHDNIHCDRALEKQHLDKALEREALILDAGDLFCAMQGKYDPRSSKDQLRPEDKGDNYLDLITAHAGDDYRPYARNWLLLAKGNHESSILQRHGHDLTSKLAGYLNGAPGGRVHVGGFGGWVRFLFSDKKRVRDSKNLKYFHGSGGGGPVTRGVIQTNRQAVYLPDADVVWNGHTHDSYWLPIARERITNHGVVGRDLVHFVRTPGYKDEYNDGTAGWHIERGGPPKPIGALWMVFRAEKRGFSRDLRIEIEFVQAVS
jgi:hypothetical protein